MFAAAADYIDFFAFLLIFVYLPLLFRLFDFLYLFCHIFATILYFAVDCYTYELQLHTQ